MRKRDKMMWEKYWNSMFLVALIAACLLGIVMLTTLDPTWIIPSFLCIGAAQIFSRKVDQWAK